jgi:hypothetical protein
MISWRESANDYKLIGADLQFMTGNRTSSFFGEAYVRGAGVIWRIVAGEFAAFSCETRDVSELKATCPTQSPSLDVLFTEEETKRS